MAATEALRAEIARAINNLTAGVTVIVQLREGGGDDTELVAQLKAANDALEAALAGEGSPPAGPPEAQ